MCDPQTTARARRWLALPLLALAVGGCAHARAQDPEGAAVAVESPRVAGEVGPTAGIAELERAFERSAEVIGPSVVSITSEREHPGAAEVPAFLRPFGAPDGVLRGLGSGVIVDARGYVLTNNHVVDGADRLRVRLADDREFEAEVVGTDPKTDLAVVRIDADGLVPALTAESDRLRVGQWVMAIGSPFGLSKTVTAGIVSATGRGGMGITDYGDFIQTDAAINQGNSGGPLIDLHGRVVGINTAIASPTGGSNGVGFAIPIDLAKVVMKQLMEHGSVERGWMGIVMGRLTPELAKSFGYRGTDGVLVDDITDPKGPGAKAGLRAGDIIVAIDGKRVRDMTVLRNGIAAHRPGSKLELGVFREGGTRKVEVELGAVPGEGKKSARTARPGAAKERPKAKAPRGVGLQLVDLSDEARARFRIAATKGALVAGVARDSLAAAYVEPGDVLVEVAGEKVRSASHAERLLAKANLDEGVRVRIQSGEYGHFVVLRRPR